MDRRAFLENVGSGAASAPLGASLIDLRRPAKDPENFVVNADHRAHDVKNLFIVDGSNFVTSGRGQPTITIQALAFRARTGSPIWSSSVTYE